MTDYLVTYVTVSLIGLWYLAGSITGTVVGGGINFYMGRNWVFNSTQKSIRSQVLKYILVWCGNLFIVTVGVYLLTHFGNVHYMLSKIIVSGLIGTMYNYFMQKQFIFTH